MAIAIVMPKLGMTMKEGTVIEWRASVGQRLRKGEIVLVIESEKAEAEIEAPADGVLRHIYVEPETTVPSGTLLAAMTEGADEAFEAAAFQSEYDANDERAPGRAGRAGGRAGRAEGGAGASVGGRGAAPADSGSAPGKASPARGRAGRASGRAGGPASPAARRRARDLGVELASVEGSGPGGRVTREDVERAASAAEADAATVVTAAADGASLIEVAPGVSLEVLDRGDQGERVLLLPGLGTDASAFARVVPALADRYRVRAVNGRGVGRSDAPAADAYDVSVAAADVRALAGPEPVHLVGASMGAAIALETAIAYPQAVRSLVLITPFSEQSGRLAAVADAWLRLAALGSAELLAAAIVPWMFSSDFLADDARRRRALRAFAATSGQISGDTVARQVAGIARWSGTRAGRLAAVAVPTLVLGAGEDLLVVSSAEVAAAIPGAQHLLIEAAGHALTVEAPEAVAKILLAHLAGICQPPPSDL